MQSQGSADWLTREKIYFKPLWLKRMFLLPIGVRPDSGRVRLKWICKSRDSYVASVGAKRTDSVGELYLVEVNVHQTLKRPPPSTGGVLEGLYWINSIHQIALALCWITPELTSCTSIAHNPSLSQTASPRTEPSLTTEIRVPFRSNTCALLFVTHQSHSRFSSSRESRFAHASFNRHSQDSVQPPSRYRQEYRNIGKFNCIEVLDFLRRTTDWLREVTGEIRQSAVRFFCWLPSDPAARAWKNSTIAIVITSRLLVKY